MVKLVDEDHLLHISPRPWLLTRYAAFDFMITSGGRPLCDRQAHGQAL